MLFLALRATARGRETRRRIHQAIQERPGLTKTELCKLTGLSWGTVSHHVRVLARSKDIAKAPSLRKVYLYANNVGSDQFAYMRLLREDLPSQILQHLNAKPRSGIQDLSRALDVSRKIVRRHVSELVDAGLVNRSSHYRPKFEVALPWLSFGLRSPRGLSVGTANSVEAAHAEPTPSGTGSETALLPRGQ